MNTSTNQAIISTAIIINNVQSGTLRLRGGASRQKGRLSTCTPVQHLLCEVRFHQVYYIDINDRLLYTFHNLK